MLSAREFDAADELKGFRSRFKFTDDTIYLDGNSLGRMPLATASLMDDLMENQWAHGLVRSWEKWFALPQELGAKIAKVIGAREDEVLVCDSTTVNLFKLALAAVVADPPRKKIVTDNLNFPSDLYALSGIVQSLGNGYALQLIESTDDVSIECAQIEPALETAALLTLSHVSFKSGFLYDMSVVTGLAHAQGVPVLWDLSHSVGAVPIELTACGVDLAIGCTYKYLNGGPGAPAFLYVRRDLQEKLSNPIWGWFGRRDAFDFGLDYAPRKGVSRFMVGTPPVLSMATIGPGVDLTIEAGPAAIRRKSTNATEFLCSLWEEYLRPLGVTLKSPRESWRRGSHVSFGHPHALEIDQALIREEAVVPDFRAPDNIRFGVSPLYTTFGEIEEGVLRFRKVLETESYRTYLGRKPAVT